MEKLDLNAYVHIELGLIIYETEMMVSPLATEMFCLQPHISVRF